MVLLSYPPTPKQLAANVGCFLAGASLFAVGAHLFFASIAPQQARNDLIKNRLRKLHCD